MARPIRASSVPAPRPADPMTVTLADVCRRVAVLEQAVGTLSRRRDTRDPVRDEALLSAIAMTFGSRVFTAANLIAHGPLDPGLLDALAGVTARALGGWLRRLRVRPPVPYVLRRLGREGGGYLWSLDVSDDVHTPGRRAPSRGAR